MNTIKRLIDGHKFFVKETPSFVGNFTNSGIWSYPHYKLSLKDKLYYPVAYIKFMWQILRNK